MVRKDWEKIQLKNSNPEMAAMSVSFPRTNFTLPLPKPSSGTTSASAKILSSPSRINCSSSTSKTPETTYTSSSTSFMKNLACGLLAALAVSSSTAMAGNVRLPPLSTDPNRCQQAFVGNTIGQANGVYDKAIDLRFCDYTNDKSNIKGKSLAAALMSGAKFDGADLSEVVMSKAYAVGASFKGVDFTNAVLDRVNFGKANLQGAVFRNAVLSGSTFVEADLKDATFEDTIIGYIDLQNLCLNATLDDEGRALLGCR